MTHLGGFCGLFLGSLGLLFPIALVVCWVFRLALVLLCIPLVYLGVPYASFLNKTLITYQKKKIMTHYTQHCEHQLASSKPNSPIKDNVITNQVER
jgi:hypothetical protein